MKFKLLAIFVLAMGLFLGATSFTPQRDKEKKEQQGHQGNQGKGQNKGHKPGDQGNGNSQGNQGKEKGKDKLPPGQANKSGDSRDRSDADDDVRDGKGRKVKVKDDGVVIWDRETYRDRKDYRKKEKVTICHKVRSGNPVTITVSANALKAHLGHGDVEGSCPAASDRRFSDIFEKRRVNYYNDLADGQEEVLYSRSILDYALMRLTESRLQLNQYERSGMPASELEPKREAVQDLEQNVSLLETVVAAAATFIATRLL